MEVGARDVQELPPASTRALQPWAPTPMEPRTRHTDLTVEELRERRDGGKRMIQRLNEENGRRENTVLSTWRRCKQGWPRLSQTTDRWPRSRSLLLNKYLFNLIYILGYIFLKIYPNKK